MIHSVRLSKSLSVFSQCRDREKDKWIILKTISNNVNGKYLESIGTSGIYIYNHTNICLQLVCLNVASTEFLS